MNNRLIGITKYFRNAVAAQTNMGIDFKVDNFFIIDPKELGQGKLNPIACKGIFTEAKKNTFDDEAKSRKKSLVNVIICAKTIKTIYEANEKVQDEIEELTGVYYIPAILNSEGLLIFDEGDKKLPWFPREYLTPMLEPKLAIGEAETVDNFISNHVDSVEKIKYWSDYVTFFTELYESVTESEFNQNIIRNLDDKEPFFELEKHVYVFLDKTVYSTFHIMNLYNHLQDDNQPKELYDNFISTHMAEVSPLIENDLSKMQVHSGQMNGEYPLSPSQREAVNHFNAMNSGEILAVNGPPGTGKTTLLQTIVADMYVKRAMKKEKAPLIVASSTNNQAVTNIIASFGNIKKMGISNLEERWIEGVNSFASYFPSFSKVKDAKRKGYQYTNQKGEFFVSDVEDKANIVKSKAKLIQSCNEYFGSEYKNITSCQEKLHQELLVIEKSKTALLSLAQEASQSDLNGETIDKCLEKLFMGIEEKQTAISNIHQRIIDWESCYKKIPFYVKWLKFLKSFARKIQTEFRLFINDEEQNFLNEHMNFYEIKEKYSQLYAECNKAISDLKEKKSVIEKIKKRYDSELERLQQHNINLHGENDEKYRLDLEYINDLMDKKHRYVEFWLAVHYYECRWLSGEDELSEKQKSTNYTNVLEKFYNRLSMITPCLVMTFYMLPRQFLAFGEQKNFFMYNYIDLLIIDEAGQVSPEIAAGSFSLAKKSVVVGDIYQIEPVWSVNRALDKALAVSNGAIQSLDEFELLVQTGLNSSYSSVMKVAAKCCKYEKFDEKGLFLSEHRRCYDEIIDYCNRLVYKENLQPMRGKGMEDEKLAIKHWPQMGFKQIDTEYSNRNGSSRLNRLEAEQIVEWIKNNFKLIANAYPKEAKENLIGIITPFKAQVECIKSELKKQMPTNHSKISVGTVHTFQGAERNIIILSTVYGKQDGCFFIDANKSLMNVAVSRAKDKFFVFGDINCLKDTQSSASGLLKKCISNIEMEMHYNEL
ncbi:superfamily I DNA and/or RNA helicase [Natranaerovirga pectinivora]|uniref:Superfamily I DNA and/or RNA helicase n=1 Tax=Natranaerovirga pectinivora TaxID=682400 RepID=A0A4R3MSC4_9FIRM|nr:AAA domain-containing protein [Natranaerovirga pectinivora]TCT17128.1 superfamily I DNA and/or RNA helicase [Natranaerovirga pectinivora]